jgi:hypothetical protein
VIIKDLLASSFSLKHNKQVMEIRDNASDPKVSYRQLPPLTVTQNKSSTSIFDDGSWGLVRTEY